MIDVLMIVKNEYEGIQVTLNSLMDNFDGRIFVYDTGSCDGTQEVARKIGGDRVFIGQGTFDNFAQARNDAQDWVLNTFDNVEWIMWLDANDVASGPFPAVDPEVDAYLVCQEWFPRLVKFYNYRLFKLTFDVRWFGYVHEWTKLPDTYKKATLDSAVFTIRQDRSQNCESSVARWKKDVDLLRRQVEDSPDDSRYYFYLGRALKDVGENEEAAKYLRMRLGFNNFPEERYWARFYLAELVDRADWEKRAQLFLEAYEECGRVEALCSAAAIYIEKRNWHRAFMALTTACQLKYPTDSTLFVLKDDYDYTRWHLMGIVAYYVGQDGSEACKNAIAARAQPIDESNLKWYEPKPLYGPTSPTE